MHGQIQGDMLAVDKKILLFDLLRCHMGCVLLTGHIQLAALLLDVRSDRSVCFTQWSTLLFSESLFFAVILDRPGHLKLSMADSGCVSY